MIVPVILCGGSGTRLWPVSRQALPKPFIKLHGEHSLFQESVLRLTDTPMPVVVTNDDYRFIARGQAYEIGYHDASIIIEPMAKNTAPAILAAARHIESAYGGDSLMLVMPSDHIIPDKAAFQAMVERGVETMAPDQIICFGIQPDRPATGFGYIEVESIQEGECLAVEAFFEKPDIARAEVFCSSGKHLWNAGIFLMRVDYILERATALAPALNELVAEAYRLSSTDLGFIRLDAKAWSKAQEISFDYAFMEKDDGIGCMVFRGAWSDLGDWEVLGGSLPESADGNRLNGMVEQIACRESILWNNDNGKVLVGLGLDNILAVNTGDAVLVADRSRAQDIRNVVSALAEKGYEQAASHPKVLRPWGSFETLISGVGYKVKVIDVDCGGRLSLQSHEHRSEHWVVVEGVASVIIEDAVLRLEAGQSTFVPVGKKHQLVNDGDVRLRIVEVQIGGILSEDDIMRYEDIYGRKD